MKQSKSKRRYSLSPNRNLRLERLEMRTLMAAGLFGENSLVRPLERLETNQDVRPLAAEVRAGQDHVLAQPGVGNRAHSAEPPAAIATLNGRFQPDLLFSQNLQSQARSSIDALADVSPASVLVHKSLSQTEVSARVARETLEKSSWSLITHENKGSVDRPDFGQRLSEAVPLNRITIRELEHRLSPVSLVANIAELDVRAVRREVRPSDAVNVSAAPAASAPSTFTAGTLLERGVDIVALNRAYTESFVRMTSAPENLGRLMPISAYSYQHQSHDVLPLGQSLSDGGMVDLRVLPRSDRAVQAANAPESKPWTIDAESVERAARTATETMSPQPSPPNDGVFADSSDGGMIQIAAVNLPKSIPSTDAQRIEIQLDPSIGHFRSFQLAASPGHDRDPGELRMTLAWAWRDQVISEPDVHIRDEAEVESTPLPPLAYTGVVIVSGMMLTTEMLNRKRSSNLYSLRRYSTGK